MFDESRSASFASDDDEELSMDGLELPGSPHQAAILQTHDDISTDSECSSIQDDCYDLQLVVRALKQTIEQQRLDDEALDLHESSTHLDHHRAAALVLHGDNDEKENDTNTEHLDHDELDEGPLAPTPTLDESSDDSIQTPSSSSTPTANVLIFDSGISPANGVHLPPVNLKTIPPNNLTAADQEVQDEPVATAIHYIFSNQFMKAKHILEKEAATDPLHSLGLCSMLFLKAIMTNDATLHQECMDALLYTYDLTTSQLEATVRQHSIFGHSVFQYLQHCYYYIKCGNHHISSHPRPVNTPEAYTCNGILRAHVIKAECCLQMAILYLMQGTYIGYLRCGINLRRAYSSYFFVWQEHQRMDQGHSHMLDQDTLSGLQFGIGAIHLILDSLPSSIRRLVSSFNWEPERSLGQALLHLCKQGKRIRSPWAALMLLAYYTTLTNYCPEMLTMEYTQPAIEALLETQQLYPHSALILYFAGRTSRLGGNMMLSTQSFMYAIEISKSDWAELAMFHVCTYEMALNAMIQMQWDDAMQHLSVLIQQGYWSPVILQYLHGACLAMRGQHTDAILAYAQVLRMAMTKSTSSSTATASMPPPAAWSTPLTSDAPAPGSSASFASFLSLSQPLAGSVDQQRVDLEKYVEQKVLFFEQAGYQDCGLTLSALEYVALMDGLAWMSTPQLEHSHMLVEQALQQIMDMQQLEYMIRKREIDPETPLSTFVDQRAALLWLKAVLLNVAGRHEEAIPHVNWVVDHADEIEVDRWLIPFTYWQAGLIAWHMDNRTHARQLWEQACCYKHYPFETRLTLKIHLAMQKADQLGVPSTHKMPSSLKSKKLRPISLALSSSAS